MTELEKLVCDYPVHFHSGVKADTQLDFIENYGGHLVTVEGFAGKTPQCLKISTVTGPITTKAHKVIVYGGAVIDFTVPDRFFSSRQEYADFLQKQNPQVGLRYRENGNVVLVRGNNDNK